jgi:hypothetical protein
MNSQDKEEVQRSIFDAATCMENDSNIRAALLLGTAMEKLS